MVTLPTIHLEETRNWSGATLALQIYFQSYHSYGQLHQTISAVLPSWLPSLGIGKLLPHHFLMPFECSRPQSKYQK